jgi:hypothetical protein
MKTRSTTLAGLAFVLAGAFTLGAGCESEKGPAEKAGEKIDSAAKDAKDALSPPAGPAEKAGEKIDKAVKP